MKLSLSLAYKLPLLSIIYLCSCSTLELTTLNLGKLSNNLFAKNSTIPEDIKNLPYASQLVNFQNDSMIMILKEDKDGRLTWVDSGNNGYITKNGKIIKTFGLSNNIEIASAVNINQLRDDLVSSKSVVYKDSFIKFTLPETDFLPIRFIYTLEGKGELDSLLSGKKIPYLLIKESFSAYNLQWEGENFYWIDHLNGNVIQSKVNLAPNLPKIRSRQIKGYLR